MIDPLIYCLGLLKRRLRSSSELEDAMKRKGIEAEERSSTLEYLKETKLVDDHAFAGAWVRTKDKLSPRGKSLLRMELIQKGVPKETIDQVLSERAQTQEEEETPSDDDLVRRLVASRERTYSNLDPATKKRRLMGFLQRRGFSYDVIRRILDT